MSLDARAFRTALSSFATGVTIVTAPDKSGAPIGMTASSFNSVSVDPPLILWSVTKTALSAEGFRAAEHFAVHVLGSDQTELAVRFAKSGSAKFDACDYAMDARNVPVLGEAACRFDCRTWAVYEGGDHWIIVGEVLDFCLTSQEGLIFAAGTFADARPKPTGASSAPSGTDGGVSNLLLYHVSQAFHGLSGRFYEEVRQAGLSVPEWRVLATLERHSDPCSLDEVAKLTFVRVDALSDLLMRMEDKGLCHLQAGTASSTAAGRACVTALYALGAQLEADVLKNVSDQERANLIALLTQIASNCSDSSE